MDSFSLGGSHIDTLLRGVCRQALASRSRSRSSSALQLLQPSPKHHQNPDQGSIVSRVLTQGVIAQVIQKRRLHDAALGDLVKARPREITEGLMVEEPRPNW